MYFHEAYPLMKEQGKSMVWSGVTCSIKDNQLHEWDKEWNQWKITKSLEFKLDFFTRPWWEEVSNASN